MKKTPSIALISLAVLLPVISTACSDNEETKVPTDVSHDVESLQTEVDDMLKQIDEVGTIDTVSSDLLSS